MNSIGLSTAMTGLILSPFTLIYCKYPTPFSCLFLLLVDIFLGFRDDQQQSQLLSRLIVIRICLG
jgi:hypothetical protein